MGSRIPSHQLSSGLYVSGRPEQYKERQPTMASRAMPYTGGDVKKSGELGKMFDIPVLDPTATTSSSSLKPRPSSSAHNSGSLRSGSNSGPQPKSSNSGPVKKSSGPLPLQPTGLITSGPLGSSGGPLGSSVGRRSGQLDPSVVKPGHYGPAVTSLSEDVKLGFKISKTIMWVCGVVFAIGLMAGVFMMVTVKKVVILVVVGGIFAPVLVLVGWNYGLGRRGLMRFLRRYPDAELRGAKNGEYVKVTGVVTCGSIPLESSFQRLPRCIYVSTELHEYRGWGGKSANPNHRRFTWGSRHVERHVADFYISDFQSGLRALVKAGSGAKVAPFVKPATVVDITKENREFSPSFLRWLAERNLSSDDRIMRLEEGYIKEGSTVSVMGIVQRHDNMLMIVPSPEPVSTGIQWRSCLLPTYIEGLVLICDESQGAEVIPV
ncbi:ubiquitin-specific protease family C19-related protein [Tasmannia lanceolata]|uniref:ubiquitin-specific protease family C19-related protein n=1 Tax=Tasmannia lanceolata TaxID=3420 RepID=UPI004062E426